MSALALLTYKIATEPREFELIHRLNYETFVEEIPQHAANPTGRLVDRFHDENTYVVCMNGDELTGMIALRGRRPFSLTPSSTTWTPICREDASPARRGCSRSYRVFARAASFSVCCCAVSRSPRNAATT